MESWIGNIDETNHEDVLKGIFGFSNYRPGQKEIIEAALSGRNVFATMSTGSGKSLCYQEPAIIAPKGSTTIVVSPLIALMRDQSGFLQEHGVAAVDLHSEKSDAERRTIMEQVRDRAYALLYVSPEQLTKGPFIEATANANLGRLVVDEAHCISQWGHDFRPEYMSIYDFIQRRKIPQTLAFTATASQNVKREVREQLRLQDAFEYHGQIERPNLLYDVVKITDHKKRKPLMAKYIERLAPNDNDGVIVYCGTRDEAEEVAQFLREKGLPAEYYHAGLEPYERKEREEQFLNDEKRILVATNAFGMGVDKPNIRLIIHHKIPGSIQAYLQETGRAGRDGKSAACILFYHESDRNIQDHFIFEKTLNFPFLKSVYEAIRRQYEKSRQKAGDWFPLNRIGLYQAFTTRSGKETRRRDTAVNAAIDFMKEKGVLEEKAGYIKLNKFPDSEVGVQNETRDRKLIAEATLEQIITYANSPKPDQKRLIELFNSEIILPTR